MLLGEIGRWLCSADESDFPFQCRHCRAGYDIQFHVCPRCSGFCVDSVKDVRRSHDTAD